MLTGRVKFALGKPKDSKHEGKPMWSDVVIDIAGADAKIFVDYGTSDWNLASSYKKGDQVQIIEDKGKYKLIGTGGQMAEAVQSLPAHQPAPQAKPGLDIEKAQDYAKVYAAIFIKLSEKLPVTTPAEVVGTAASTVFIALTRN